MELGSWKQNSVYAEVEDFRQKCISTRWGCSLTSTSDDIIPKARLVGRGIGEFTANIQKYSPTCDHESLKACVYRTAFSALKENALDLS